MNAGPMPSRSQRRLRVASWAMLGAGALLPFCGGCRRAEPTPLAPPQKVYINLARVVAHHPAIRSARVAQSPVDTIQSPQAQPHYRPEPAVWRDIPAPQTVSLPPDRSQVAGVLNAEELAIREMANDLRAGDARRLAMEEQVYIDRIHASMEKQRQAIEQEVRDKRRQLGEADAFHAAQLKVRLVGDHTTPRERREVAAELEEMKRKRESEVKRLRARRLTEMTLSARDQRAEAAVSMAASRAAVEQRLAVRLQAAEMAVQTTRRLLLAQSAPRSTEMASESADSQTAEAVTDAATEAAERDAELESVAPPQPPSSLTAPPWDAVANSVRAMARADTRRAVQALVTRQRWLWQTRPSPDAPDMTDEVIKRLKSGPWRSMYRRPAYRRSTQ